MSAARSIPSYVEGQIQGGVAQGIGWALNEEYIYDKDGRMENPGFLDYRVPVASDLPMIDAIMVEVPNPRHPFGARGVGEVPIVPPMAAVANAIARRDRACACATCRCRRRSCAPRSTSRSRRGSRRSSGSRGAPSPRVRGEGRGQRPMPRVILTGMAAAGSPAGRP